MSEKTIAKIQKLVDEINKLIKKGKVVVDDGKKGSKKTGK
jgi:hypothetical protein